MIGRLVFLGALLAASFAYFFSGGDRPHDPYIQGRNKTVLFIANSEHGLANVHVATSSALLENYPDIEVHYASFPSVRSKLERVSSFARAKTPTASNIVFHELKDLTFSAAIIRVLVEEERDFIAPPASAGIGSFSTDFQLWISPWLVEDHLELFEEISALIDEVDPAVVVLDTWFRPAIDATRAKNRQHAFVTPNVLADNFLGNQPFLSKFWKYPALASGFPFPVPLRKIVENVYLNMRFIYGATKTPALAAKKAALAEKGLKDPINFFGIHRSDAPWITQTTEGASIPMDFVPPNVTCVGPMVLSGASASEQDPELASWLKRAPTVLINLGSNVAYDEPRATAMSLAVAEVMEKTDVQVIWKFNKHGDYGDEALSPLNPYLEGGRLRLRNWLTADPSSLLETGNIVASIHHGGSGCYHEAIATGVPQVILPMWADLYNFAGLAETIGVGVWACKESSPHWGSECLASSFLEVLDSATIRNKARQLGDKVQAGDKGRDVAAREVAKLAYVR